MRKFVRLSSVPDRAHPLVKKLFREMHRHQIGVLDMAERSGVNKNTLKDWRTRTVPRVPDLEACFNVIGYRLTAVSNHEEGE